MNTTTTAPARGLRLLPAISQQEADTPTEQELRRLSRERHMANHPAGRRRRMSESPPASAPPRLHVVPPTSDTSGPTAGADVRGR